MSGCWRVAKWRTTTWTNACWRRRQRLPPRQRAVNRRAWRPSRPLHRRRRRRRRRLRPARSPAKKKAKAKAKAPARGARNVRPPLAPATTAAPASVAVEPAPGTAAPLPGGRVLDVAPDASFALHETNNATCYCVCVWAPGYQFQDITISCTQDGVLNIIGGPRPADDPFPALPRLHLSIRLPGPVDVPGTTAVLTLASRLTVMLPKMVV